MMEQLARIAAIFKARAKRSARRQIANALLGGLALLFLGLAIIAGIAAIGVVLAARWGALAACLIIASAALVVAALLVAVVAQRAKEARRRQRAELAEWNQTILAVKAIAPAFSGGKGLLIVTALGVLVGLMSAKHEPQDDG